MQKLISSYKELKAAAIIFSLILLLFVNYSCSGDNVIYNKSNRGYRNTDIAELADTGNIICVSFKNESEKSVNISFSLNGMFWFSREEMINYIREYETDSLPDTNILISKAYNFVINNTTHYEEYTMPRRFEYSPSILLNSLGLGICDNRGAVLAHILKEMGFESRCVQLGGHLVTEVYDNGKWKMLDADYDTYFLKNDIIASVREIKSNFLDCNIIKGYSINDLFFYLFPSYYLEYFTSEENNEVQDWYMQDVYWQDDYFTLPAGSELRFPVDNPNRNNHEFYSYGKLTILNYHSKFFNIPFVVHSVSGNGSLLNPFQGYVTEKSNCSFYTPGSYMIDADSLEVYFYINPHLINRENYDDKTELIYTTSDSLELKTIISTGFVNNLPKPVFKNYQELIKASRNKYNNILKELPEFHNKEIEILTNEDLLFIFTEFYKDINNNSALPDSIVNKFENVNRCLPENQIDSVVFKRVLSNPYFRNTFFIMLIEFPAELIYDVLKYNSIYFS